MKTDYSIRQPALTDLANLFGSYSRAWDVTGGDLSVCCFFLANPDRAGGAVAHERRRPDGGGFAELLYDAAIAERAQSRKDATLARWREIAMACEVHGSVKGAAAALGISVSTASKARARLRANPVVAG